MNVRKPANYNTMYREVAEILTQNLPQMEEIHAIGKAVSRRPEKGAAVAAAEFLQANFPDRTGFSPRNVRRMRDFYKAYENDKPLLQLAMKLGWTLNVVIMEAELTREARKWYLKQAQVQQWSKAILLEKLASAAHLEKPLDAEADTCYTNKEAEDGPQHPVVVAFRRCWFVSPFHEIAALLQDLPIHFLRRTSRRMLHARC